MNERMSEITNFELAMAVFSLFLLSFIWFYSHNNVTRITVLLLSVLLPLLSQKSSPNVSYYYCKHTINVSRNICFASCKLEIIVKMIVVLLRTTLTQYDAGQTAVFACSQPKCNRRNINVGCANSRRKQTHPHNKILYFLINCNWLCAVVAVCVACTMWLSLPRDGMFTEIKISYLLLWMGKWIQALMWTLMMIWWLIWNHMKIVHFKHWTALSSVCVNQRDTHAHAGEHWAALHMARMLQFFFF